MDAKLNVVSPIGEKVSDKAASLAPRLDTLDGKTVCEIWNGGFKADVMFPIIEQMLRERYPTVTMIPFTEFPTVTIASLGSANKAETLEAVRAALLAKGCDAVITGNGG
ncbi:MAG: hypothetical protein HYU44_09460 [Betaproteobacteria bacterium]|nr:hypothetical protein [Betaproteobacteria bacterium]MBI2292463.1 hypothetical protein [Betaproteobacteria bacterium]MBI3052443.1 hypothetical protein [Betaproteobacteria bacterium]